MENHPYGWSINEYFPKRRICAEFEGGCVWLAEKDGMYYVITLMKGLWQIF